MLRIAVLLSGGGTNLQALIDQVTQGKLPVKITQVIADRPAGGLDRAEQAGIPALLLDRKVLKNNLSKAIMDLLEGECDYIVLAGYLSILSDDFIDQWQNRIINIHPSLLPRHGGMGMYGIKVHQSVLDSGDNESGCSVHFVTKVVDGGRVILQKKVSVKEGDTAESLQKRVLAMEHQSLSEALILLDKQHQ